MIPRYTTPEMAALWSEEEMYRTWLEVELAACRSMEEAGSVPEGTADTVEKAVRIDPERIERIERETRHDVIAFLSHVQEQAGDPGRFIHLGMTSSDVLDTAFALRLARAGRIVIKEIKGLRDALREQALGHKWTVTVGRTHGVHAQPITLGLVLALWYEETGRDLDRVRQAVKGVSVGKLSGAVGTYRNLSPEMEASAMRRLGLGPAPVSSQIVQRDRHAWFFASLAVLAGTIEKMALNVRLWQQTEVGEAFEPFGKGQKGSSAMPHKRNPVLAENLCGLARLVRAYADASMENIALWHERDISHSSVERVIAPDATTAIHFMTRRMAGVIKGLEVDAERMRKNLDMGGGAVHSEDVLLELTRRGMGRQEAYAIVQRAAMAAAAGRGRFIDLLEKDGDVAGRLGRRKLRALFDPKRSLAHVDAIFERVFGRR